METIIAGRFATKSAADAAAASMAGYVQASDICIFHNNPPGQHGTYPVGGDEDEDPGATHADGSSASTAAGAALTGGLVGALAGPVGAIAGAAVGAYAGSVIGAMQGLGDDDRPGSAPLRRPGGIILAVRIADPAGDKRVVDDLRAGGAADIEEADGSWIDGDWVDFDPVAVPRLVAGEEARQANRPGNNL